jgi:hypothetical protein
MKPDVDVSGLTELREQGRMTWMERERGWAALPDEVVNAFTRGGFEECKRATTTSRRDLRPAGGVWQGVNHATGSVASAIWVARAPQRQALLFIEIDGEVVGMRHHRPAPGDHGSDPDEGGES